jgi:hypothetical protein
MLNSQGLGIVAGLFDVCREIGMRSPGRGRMPPGAVPDSVEILTIGGVHPGLICLFGKPRFQRLVQSYAWSTGFAFIPVSEALKRVRRANDWGPT